ncbi:Dyp-type peroxidase [Corynebacterium qintianiae]|uniref:Dyp-type peroxidase n=1 Tax=Corynebacterium qintianiae TaxID=2709392 RepID=UPI0013EC8334|nr:Dyp-type peroxidase [Corynebacterium qintianiae]
MNINRRHFFALGGSLAAGAGLTACARGSDTAAGPASPEELIVEFAGEHQAGITTPMQNNLHFAAFDLAEDVDRDDVIALLARWTDAARRLTLGGDVSAKGAFGGGENFPPDDSGEAYDLGPAGLTLTFGFGRSFFRQQLGLDSALPGEFTTMPTMTNDFLNPAASEGDLCVQACANDPQVASHAVRNLTRLAVPTASLRWSQIGFGRAGATTGDQATPRNLFGQKDGTANIRAEDNAALDEHVWIPSGSSQPWAAGGTYMTVRRIQMNIEVWDTLRLREQERVTGRDKPVGAPLSGTDEFDEPDFNAVGPRGLPLIDRKSHLYNVHPAQNGGIRMLRRPFNFVDGSTEQGRMNAGLFFVAFTRTPDRFATVHRSMSRDEMFTEYLKTTGTGTYLVPPGVGPQGYIGETLLA